MTAQDDDFEQSLRNLRGEAGGAPEDSGEGLHHAVCGEHWKAIECYERDLARTPGDKLTLFGLSTSLIRVGCHEDAVDHLRRLVAIDPTWAGAHLELGRALHGFGDDLLALRSLRKSTELAPSRAATYLTGIVLSRLRQDVEAVEQLRSFLAVEPGNAAAALALVKVLHRAGKLDEAIVVLDEAVKAHANDPSLWYMRGVLLCLCTGELLEALDSFTSAIEADPQHRDAQVCRVKVLQRLGRHDDALLAARLAVLEDPSDAEFGELLLSCEGAVQAERNFQNGWVVRYIGGSKITYQAKEGPVEDIGGASILSHDRALDIAERHCPTAGHTKILAEVIPVAEALEFAHLQEESPPDLSELRRNILQVMPPEERKVLAREAFVLGLGSMLAGLALLALMPRTGGWNLVRLLLGALLVLPNAIHPPAFFASTRVRNGLAIAIALYLAVAF